MYRGSHIFLYSVRWRWRGGRGGVYCVLKGNGLQFRFPLQNTRSWLCHGECLKCVISNEIFFAPGMPLIKWDRMSLCVKLTEN